jgi:DNA-binding transcriptional ArsR family regulator
MPGGQRKSWAAWEAHARSHPLRRRILALYAQDEQRSLATRDLLPELGEEGTTYSAVAYHVRVLKHAGLLPDAAGQF